MRRAEPFAQWIDLQKKVLTLDFQAAQEALGALELCPIEELLLGPVPGPIGGGGRAVLIASGLLLMYRRLSWWPISLAAATGWCAALCLAPLQHEQSWTIVLERLVEIGPLSAVVYLGYCALASPLILIVLILSPYSAPITKRGRLVYGAMLGCGLAAAQWFILLPSAAYLSLGLVGLLSRPLDRVHRAVMPDCGTEKI